MKKFIFNMALLSMVFVLASCSSESLDPSDDIGGDITAKTIVSNSQLAIAFNGALNDQSIAITQAQGRAGINRGVISLKVEKGAFKEDSAAISLSSSDNTGVKQMAAITNSVTQAVNAILTVKENAVVGLSTESTVEVIIKNATSSTATVTIKTVDGSTFEDKTTTKIFKINLTGRGFEIPVIDESAFSIPAIASTTGRAQIAGFTIPAGFAEVTSKVAVNFNNKDNLTTEKFLAVKKAIESMVLPANKGIVIASVGEFKMDGYAGWDASGNITVTFKAASGYKFEGASTRKVKINFRGPFIDTKQTIDETAFTTTARGKASGRAGVSPIQFNKNFAVGNLPNLSFTSKVEAKEKEEAIAGLDNMFYEEYKPFGGKLPEGVRYNKGKGNVKIKKMPNNVDDDWNDYYAWFEVTFDVADTDYVFAGDDKTKKTVYIKIKVLPSK